MVIRSIRWRIQLWYAVVLGSIVVTLLFLHHRHERELIYQHLDEGLKEPITILRPYLRTVRAQLAGEDVVDRPRGRPFRDGRGPERKDRYESPLPLEGGPYTVPFDPLDSDARGSRRISRRILDQLEKIEERGFYFATWLEREPELRSENIPPNLQPPNPLPPRPGVFLGSDETSRYAMHLTPSGNLLVIGKDTTGIEKQLSFLAWKLAGIGGALVFGGLFVGYWLVRRSLRPIKDISETAAELAAGKRLRLIEEGDTDSELGQLAGVLNDTFTRLQSSYDQQVRFTADASHEIRTPIAVILAEGSFVLSRERTPERYREALQVCVDSAEHMSSLTESLLELARIDSGEFQIKATAGRYRDAIEQAVLLVSPLAQKRGISIKTKLQDIDGIFDPPRLNQVLINLLSNAIKYNKEGGSVHVTLDDFQGGARITIQDTGQGIPPEKLPHIFDRFYRADDSHSESTKGSTGLGLSITEAIVKAHGGQITAESEPGEGATFVIIF